MANILPPGYLKWDGSKFILDPGTSGSISGDAGGDLSGTYPDPVVSKVNGTTITDTPIANQVLTSLNGTSAAWSEITDIHVGASAAIAGTKISPDFGSQNVKTNATVSAPTLGVGSGINPPTITSGAGLPASTPPEGSLYLRTNGDSSTGAYVYQDAAWTAIGSGGGSFTAGGDLTGSSSSQTVVKANGATIPISGALTTGNILQVSGVSALSYGPLNLAGGANYVTGALPIANLPDATTGAKGIIQLAGDIAGSATSVTVAKVNGATVPAAGALTTGNGLYVSGAGALSYGPLDLSGGANYVTGTLPNANLTDSTTGTKGILQLAGDLAGSATSVTVAKVNGTTVPAGGALTTGTILRVTGASTLAYGALDLANASAITGILPSANLFQATTGTSGAVKLAGDLGGTAALPTVLNINGSSVPVGGALTTGTILRATGAATLAYGALDLANASAVTGVLPSANLFQATTGTSGAVKLANNLGGTAALPTVVDLTITSQGNGSTIYFNGTNWVNRAAGTANYIFTANGTAAPTWNNSIMAMTDIRSQAHALEVVGGTNGKAEIFCDYFTTTSNTQYTARTITLSASKAYLVAVNLWGSDGYTTYGGTNRTLHVVKAGKYYRGSSGGAILSGLSTVQDLTPTWGETPTIDLSFVISTNDILIKVTGQSTFNAKWFMETKITQVSI